IVGEGGGHHIVSAETEIGGVDTLRDVVRALRESVVGQNRQALREALLQGQLHRVIPGAPTRYAADRDAGVALEWTARVGSERAAGNIQGWVRLLVHDAVETSRSHIGAADQPVGSELMLDGEIAVVGDRRPNLHV